MAKEKLTIQDLNDALADIEDRFPNLCRDDLFTLWFLRAYATENEELAARAVSGGAGDKGIDALLIDDAARGVFVIQAKFRKKLLETSEKRADVIALTEAAARVGEPDARAFSAYLSKAEGYVAEQLREARKRILKHNYRLWLIFVTPGKVSKSIRKDAESFTKKMSREATIDIVDGRRLMRLLHDYLDGVAPPIPALDLEMEKAPNVTVNGVSQRYDDQNSIESWVFSMRGSTIASLYDRTGVRLFARNIRGFLGGSTSVNKGMAATLREEPGRFFYYNNGITMLCDEAVEQRRKGKTFLHVSNPQIINGQQTTRTLANHHSEAGDASVLVKVLVVPRQEDGGNNGFEDLVSRIVAGTNWQNRIQPSDLMSNDRKQIELERSLRKLGYAYIRKRQTKGEAKRLSGGKYLRFIKKHEFAQIVAACELDPLTSRTASEKLFEESMYPRVFPNADPEFYLRRYWLMQTVKSIARGDKLWGEAKWLVLHSVWLSLAPHVRSARNAWSFRRQCERQEVDLITPLKRAVAKMFNTAVKYYRRNRGKGKNAIDASAFFKSKKGSAREFARFRAESGEDRAVFERHMKKVQKSILRLDG